MRTGTAYEILQIISNLRNGRDFDYNPRENKYYNLNFIEEKLSIKKNTLKTTLSRLKKKGLVSNKNKSWSITSKGVEFLNRIKTKIDKKLKIPHSAPRVINKDESKNMIIAFDIPENLKYKRDWLRTEIKILGFAPIQKSFWMGFSPLPENFIKNLNDMGIVEYVKFFRVSEKDII